MVQSILASLPCAHSHPQTDTYHIWVGAGECHICKDDLYRAGCCICELRGGKITGYTTAQATPLPGTAFRAGLQALVCRGRRHFSLIKKQNRKMSRILKDVYENDTSTSVFYRLIIVCPRWCFRVRSQSNGAKPRQELPVGFQNKITVARLPTIPTISQNL